MRYLNILLDVFIICFTIVVLMRVFVNCFNIYSVSLCIKLIELIVEILEDLKNVLVN